MFKWKYVSIYVSERVTTHTRVPTYIQYDDYFDINKRDRQRNREGMGSGYIKESARGIRVNSYLITIPLEGGRLELILDVSVSVRLCFIRW